MDKVNRQIGFKKSDDIKKIVYGEVYVPGEKDTDGNWMTTEEIEKMSHKFMQNLRNTQIDKNHNNQAEEGIVVESFIARPNDPDFTEGAWVLATKIQKDETWELIQKGDITGYSIQGIGELIPEEVKA